MRKWRSVLLLSPMSKTTMDDKMAFTFIRESWNVEEVPILNNRETCNFRWINWLHFRSLDLPQILIQRYWTQLTASQVRSIRPYHYVLFPHNLLPLYTNKQLTICGWRKYVKELDRFRFENYLNSINKIRLPFIPTCTPNELSRPI